MEKSILNSIHNSGESFEKCVSLYYAALQKNSSFYSNYRVNVFYGHNLPKKNYQLESHGTVAFYNKYFSDYYWCPPCSREYLWNKKTEILNNLIFQKVISSRVAEKLNSNDILFWNIVSRLPFEFLYPEFCNELRQNSEIILSNIKFIPIELEKNYKEIYFNLGDKKDIYNIYALEHNGIIGLYDMFLDDDFRYEKRLNHLFKDLSRRSVLSGNSAILLAAIGTISEKENSIIGYREHKYSRQNRDLALKYILGEQEGIIEPKNAIFNCYYDLVDKNMDTESKSNEVVSLAYRDYIKDNVKSLKL